MRNFLFAIALALLAGCGGQQQRTYGIEQESMVVIRAASLVGATVTIDPAFNKPITKEDLTPFAMGVAGVKDPENQVLETITVKVSPGTHRVKVERGGAVLLDQELYIGEGQTRELRVR